MPQLPSKTTYGFPPSHEDVSPSRDDRLLEGIRSALEQRTKQERILFEHQAHNDRILRIATIATAASAIISSIVEIITLLR